MQEHKAIGNQELTLPTSHVYHRQDLWSKG